MASPRLGIRPAVWLLTADTAPLLLKNKDVSLLNLEHTHSARAHTHKHIVTKSANIHAALTHVLHSQDRTTQKLQISNIHDTHCHVNSCAHTHTHAQGYTHLPLEADTVCSVEGGKLHE